MHYAPTLQAFFVAQGVEPSAKFADYVEAALEMAARIDVSDHARTRLHTLYKRFFAELPNAAPEMAATAPQEAERLALWQDLWGAHCWLGRRGDQWGFYHRSELVWNDHDYHADLFSGVLPFWPYVDVELLAHYLEVTRCSHAQTEFIPLGARSDLENWMRKTQRLQTPVANFLASPHLNQGLNENATTEILRDLTVALVEDAQVIYHLGGAEVADPEPLLSHLQADEATATLWITLKADDAEYPDSIGDALQTYFGVAQLREFVSSLLKANTEREWERVLARWKKRGLRYQQPPESEPSHDEEQPETEREPEAGHSAPDNAEQDETDGAATEENGSSQANNSGAPRGTGNTGNNASNFNSPPGNRPDDTQNSPGSDTRQPPPNRNENLALPPSGAGHYSGGTSHGRTGNTTGSGGSGSGGGGGEGEIHQALKAKIANNPHLCGPGLTLVQPESQFPSGDKVDVLLQNATGSPVSVEVKPGIQPGEYGGVWQAVKYKHLLAVEQGVPCAQIRSILVAPSVPDDVRSKCLLLGIDYVEIALP